MQKVIMILILITLLLTLIIYYEKETNSKPIVDLSDYQYPPSKSEKIISYVSENVDENNNIGALNERRINKQDMLRYKNLFKLLKVIRSKSMGEQDVSIYSHIIEEIPKVVSSGLLHPHDAVFIHDLVLRKKGIKNTSQEVEFILDEYVKIYPLPLKSNP